MSLWYLDLSEMLDLSIIIVSWNAKELLELCLQAFIDHETIYSSEIIVVDNASSDGSSEVVSKYYPKVKLIQNDSNLGFSKASNIGIKESKGRNICISNSDIIIQPELINRMVEYLDQNQLVAVLGPKAVGPDDKIQLPCKKFPSLWYNFCNALALSKIFKRSKLFNVRHMRLHLHDKIREVDVIGGAFWIIRKEAIDQVGLLDENFFFYGEDVDWCKRFWKEGWKVVYFPDAQVIHYHGGSSSKNPLKFYIQYFRAGLQYWRKHYGLPGFLGIWFIYIIHQITRIIMQSFLYIMEKSNRENIGFKIRKNFKCFLWLIHISGNR